MGIVVDKGIVVEIASSQSKTWREDEGSAADGVLLVDVCIAAGRSIGLVGFWVSASRAG